MPKAWKKLNLPKAGKRLFFENGRSIFGKEDMMTFDTLDYKRKSLNYDITAGELYGSSMLKYHLLLTEKENVHKASENLFLTALNAIMKNLMNCLKLVKLINLLTIFINVIMKNLMNRMKFVKLINLLTMFI